MSLPLPPKTRPILRRLIQRPWTAGARNSPAVRKWLDDHGYITPHFSWSSYACEDAQHTPVPGNLRPNAIRLHWKLEELRHALGDKPMTVDGPYRTPAHNKAVGGASDSRHIHADGADFFLAQVQSWGSRAHVLAVADQVFADGGMGNENSGSLHVDSRGYRARFVTWTPAVMAPTLLSPAQVDSELKVWEARVVRFRRNWLAKKVGDPRRPYWRLQLKAAEAQVVRLTALKGKESVRTVSSAGVSLVKSFEGWSGGKPYWDAYGRVWTQDYGETEGIDQHTPQISEPAAAARLQRKLNTKYLPPVLAAAKGHIKFLQREVNAEASISYNVGPGIFDAGHTMGDAIRTGDRQRIADAFLVYDVAGGQVLLGLVRRRHAERAMFLGQKPKLLRGLRSLPIVVAHKFKTKTTEGITARPR